MRLVCCGADFQRNSHQWLDGPFPGVSCATICKEDATAGGREIAATTRIVNTGTANAPPGMQSHNVNQLNPIRDARKRTGDGECHDKSRP